MVLTVPTYKTARLSPISASSSNWAFENHGRGIGDREKGQRVADGARRTTARGLATAEVGYGLEGVITDGVAGSTARQVMLPTSAAATTARASGTRRRARSPGALPEERGITSRGWHRHALEERARGQSGIQWKAFSSSQVFIVEELFGGGRDGRCVYWAAARGAVGAMANGRRRLLAAGDGAAVAASGGFGGGGSGGGGRRELVVPTPIR